MQWVHGAVAVVMLAACSGKTTFSGRTTGDGTGAASSADSGGAGTAGSGGDSGAWFPPDGPYECMTSQPRVADQGAGQCTPPTPPASVGCFNACWASPGAPGPSDCEPSIRDEVGKRCCYLGGGCGFDIGTGCKNDPLKLADESNSLASSCESQSALRRIYYGKFDRAALMPNAVVVLRAGTAGMVTFVSKLTCLATEYHDDDGRLSYLELAATDEAAYVEAFDAAPGRSVLLRFLPDGSMSEVTFGALFSKGTPIAGAFVGRGKSLFVMVAMQSNDAYAPPVLVEIPGVDQPPRIVSSPLQTWWNLDPSVLLTDGQTLLGVHEEHVLDAGPISGVGTFDLGSKTGSILFDRFRDTVVPCAIDEGRVYFVRGKSIFSTTITDCGTDVIVEHPQAGSITALAVDGGDVYWAESYDPVATGSRVFARSAGGSETRLVQLDGNVDWLGLDRDALYVVMHEDAPGSDVLVRRAR